MTRGRDADGVISGYLDVKLPSRSKKRPFGPWRCWRRYWVEARADGLLVLSASPDSASSSHATISIPAGATLCRTASRTRQFAFGAVSSAREGAPQAVYLAAKSETEADRWMAAFRRIALATQVPQLLRGRRLSRSEGDLVSEETRGSRDAISPANAFLRLLHGRRRADTLRADATQTVSPPTTLSLLGGKIASGLLSAGLGLMLSTPGGSEVEDNDEDADDASAVSTGSLLDRRRESGISVASGIYEEIKETGEVTNDDRLYENTSKSPGLRSECDMAQYEDPALLLMSTPGRLELEVSPPPLPPRRNLPPVSKLLTRKSDCEDYVSMQRSDGVTIDLVKDTSRCRIQSLLMGPEPDYLPMSPARTNWRPPDSTMAKHVDFEAMLQKSNK